MLLFFFFYKKIWYHKRQQQKNRDGAKETEKRQTNSTNGIVGIQFGKLIAI